MNPPILILHATGANRDREAAWACELAGGAPEIVHVNQLAAGERRLQDYRMLVLPGGFSYGDGLGAGKLWAVALRHRLGDELAAFVAAGRPVLGICNGFQVLCEAGLLPGALLLNSGQRFRCEDVFVRVETIRTPFTAELTKGDVLRLPIAHGDGNWRAEAEAWDDVTTHDQVVFRYCDAAGGRGTGANPNGSLDDVAGVCNRERNVVGLMPHPERASETLLGNTDGARLFRSFANGLLLGRTG